MKLMYLAAFAAVFVAGCAKRRNNVSTSQNNSAGIKARLNATVANVQETVTLTSAAIGNTVTLDGGQAGYLSNSQVFRGDAVAELNGTITDVAGAVNATSAAIANTATVNVKYAGSVSNTQLANIDPTATLNATIRGVGDDVTATSAAISPTPPRSTAISATSAPTRATARPCERGGQPVGLECPGRRLRPPRRRSQQHPDRSGLLTWHWRPSPPRRAPVPLIRTPFPRDQNAPPVFRSACWPRSQRPLRRRPRAGRTTDGSQRQRRLRGRSRHRPADRLLPARRGGQSGHGQRRPAPGRRQRRRHGRRPCPWPRAETAAASATS